MGAMMGSFAGLRRVIGAVTGVLMLLGTLLLVSAPAAQAHPLECDAGEACMWTWDDRGIWTGDGVVGDYTKDVFRCVHEATPGCLQWGVLNDRARNVLNNGCYCGPPVLSYYRDAWYGGGRIARLNPGDSATLPIDQDAGASSHKWLYS
jgi:hypothetical protein